MKVAGRDALRSRELRVDIVISSVLFVDAANSESFQPRRNVKGINGQKHDSDAAGVSYL